MKSKGIERYLKLFAEKIVRQSKDNLSRARKDGTLSESIRFEVDKTKEGYTVKFYMSSYGQFVDKGVSGTEVKRTYLNYNRLSENSPFGYSKRKKHSQPPSKALDGWAVRKGIAPRDKKGKFMKRKTLTFLIARHIGRRGIQGISFFQIPLGLGLQNFGKGLLYKINEDITNSIKLQK